MPTMLVHQTPETSGATLVVALSLAPLWFSARLFRVNTLLSGQLPTPRQVVQLLIRG
jgi:hypothetical protein